MASLALPLFQVQDGRKWHKGESFGAAANLSGMCGSPAVPTRRSGWLLLTRSGSRAYRRIATQHPIRWELKTGSLAASSEGRRALCSTFKEEEMEISRWTRRHVLKAASGAAAAGLLASSTSAEAQQVKYSIGTEPPKLNAPPNATDCHHHIYNARYPVDPGATLRPPDALVEDYRALQKRIGTTRNVLVQPSTYGIDNRCHLDAL